MKIYRLLGLILLLGLLSGCMSSHQSAKINLINLTQKYLDSNSEEEKKAIVPMIEDSFVNLSDMGDNHFRVPDLPDDIKKDLMKDIDSLGFGAKDPKWAVAYSCNRFHYIEGFKCLVKREIPSTKGSKKKEGKEAWIYDISKDYLLFDGAPVKKYPASQID